MRIKNLHLKEYKRFFDLTVDLDDNPAKIIALVGPNGCGKSSVFDSMLFVNNAFFQIGSQENLKNYTYHSLRNNPSYTYQSVEIVFDQGSFEDVFNQRQLTGAQNTIFSFRSSFRYNGSLDVRNSVAVSELRVNDYGASNASDLDKRIEDSYRRLKIKFDKYLYEKDCRPTEAMQHIIGELNSSIQNCLSLKIDNLGNIDEGKGTLFFTKDDTPDAFSYNVLSSGEKEVIDILLDLYLRKDVYKDSIYIIDEPELHLNTAIQRQLLVEINKMIPDNCQLWIATHSIGFIRALQEELNATSQIIEFTADKKWASQKYILKPMIKSRVAWNNLFRTALDDLASLVAPKRLVYCEGRAEPSVMGEERGLDATVFNIIFGETHPETLFVSSGGNTELDQRSDIAITILSKVFKDIEILVLKDRDMASGKLTCENDRQLYLQNNQTNHRVLNRFEIENYLYDKEVLKQYCLENSLKFDEIAYDALATDIVNQQIKDETGKIKKICGIITSINPEQFKKNLASCVKCTMNVYSELEKVIFERK